jgi:hypothetical protein
VPFTTDFYVSYGAHGGCDRSAGVAYPSMAPDCTSDIYIGPCAPILWFVFPIGFMRLITVRYFCHFICSIIARYHMKRSAAMAGNNCYLIFFHLNILGFEFLNMICVIYVWIISTITMLVPCWYTGYFLMLYLARNSYSVCPMEILYKNIKRFGRK